MGINNGSDIATHETNERANLAAFIDPEHPMNIWKYEYIGGELKRIQFNNNQRQIQRSTIQISPADTAIVALASRYLKSGIPKNEQDLQETVEYQYQLQSYLGLTDNQITIDFFKDLISAVKPEHNSLIPVLGTYHTQIHALKLAYETLKKNVYKRDLTEKVLFGLVCIELMKLQIRLYLVEPLARTEEGKNLDWIYMLDTIFQDYPSNSDIAYAGLESMMRHIREIRDEVAQTKANKQVVIKKYIELVQRLTNNSLES